MRSCSPCGPVPFELQLEDAGGCSQHVTRVKQYGCFAGNMWMGLIALNAA